MFIYNVTIKVSYDIHDAWLKWMQNEHMPEVVGTGCFTHSQLLRLLEVDETDGLTYAAQYFAESKSLYNQYISIFSEELRTKGLEKWGDKFVAFRTVMQIVQ
ncbi:MAG TPA: DUF4286 family protein [Parasegetibacter sp.]|jgi:hypothetical protein